MVHFLIIISDLFKGQLPGQLCSQHHHPGNPEKDEVTARLQDRVGVKLLQVSGLWEEWVG